MLKNIDVRLVSLIGELKRTRSVPAAAQKLSLSQSTVSMALARLRKHFDDPLFMRTLHRNGADSTRSRTDRGDEERRVLNASGTGHRSVFDPVTSTRAFQLCSTDIAQLTLLPTPMKRLRRSGPSMSVTLQNISDRTYAQLGSGEVDLAIGFIPARGAGFCGQRRHDPASRWFRRLIAELFMNGKAAPPVVRAIYGYPAAHKIIGG